MTNNKEYFTKEEVLSLLSKVISSLHYKYHNLSEIGAYNFLKELVGELNNDN